MCPDYFEMASCLYRKQITALLPPWLVQALAALCQGRQLYLSGGSLRDLFLGHTPHDIDLTVEQGAEAFARALAQRLRGTCISLDTEEDVARVVCRDLVVDVAAFRQGAGSIEEDLRLRDFTINALALPLEGLLAGEESDGEKALVCLDPTGGLSDLRQGLIRMTHATAFASDPLRMLRACRLAATLDCTISGPTNEAIARERSSIARSSAERVAAELDAIMLSPQAHAAMRGMAVNGLLFEVLPELALGAGVEQPKSHHLDVLEHNLEALFQMEALIARPEQALPGCGELLRPYLAEENNVLVLKWAALLHDVGKPYTQSLSAGPSGRITFYQHDRVGAELVSSLARRLRWSGRQTRRVSRLVSEHMRPFHLLNVARRGELSLKACIRLVQAADDELPGLLLLAQADALAGRGEERPAKMEDEVAQLAQRLQRVRKERVLPAQTRPSLLHGGDLIDELGLVPGPIFKTILAAVELARMEGAVVTRAEALDLARAVLTRENNGGR